MKKYLGTIERLHSQCISAKIANFSEDEALCNVGRPHLLALVHCRKK